MRRREFIRASATVGLGAAVSGLVHGSAETKQTGDQTTPGPNAMNPMKLTPPARGKINVAFVISQHATVIDFAGPWEVFQDVHVPGRGDTMEDQMPFRLYTVSDRIETLRATAGLQLVPDHTFETAPQPRVVVVGAQAGRSPAMLEWLRRVSKTADVTMSVCTGAFILARAGLLAGREVTTHHDFTERLAAEFPDLKVKRGLRFIEGDKISTAGGLTSGIDLALRIVERYFGRETAQRTSVYMEYQSTGWMV